MVVVYFTLAIWNFAMETSEQKIARLFESIRQIQAENWALKQLVLSMYAQGPDINKAMNHFMESCLDIETHNTFSTLPEDFVTNFHESWRRLASEMNHALQIAPELRNRE